MGDKIIFGKRETISFLLIFICNQIFLSFPRNMAESVGNAGWILTIYTAVISLILFLIISMLYKNFEGKDLLDVSEFLAGGFGRITVGMIFLIDYIFIIAITLREYAEDLKVISLTESPISFVMLFFAVGMIIGAFLGLEPLVRMAAISVPVIAVVYLMIILSAARYFNFSNLTPVFGTGPYDLFAEGISRISVFSGISALFLAIPFLGTYDNYKKSGVLALLLSTLFLTLGTLVYSLTLPYPNSLSNFLPMYFISRLISYGIFFQRIESIFILVWATAAFIYLSIGLFFTAHVFKKAFWLKYHRPLILPFTIIIFSIALVPQSLMEVIFLDNIVIRRFAWIVTFGVTFVVLLLATLKKKMKEGNA
ncbi:MAG: GerAB/ArcD/ProY family transporter [Clostridium sp.]|nr:GerAB/ArcD/ProY family transporter [Clostridium sp.]